MSFAKLNLTKVIIAKPHGSLQYIDLQHFEKLGKILKV